MRTIFDSILASLARASDYDRNDMAAPAVVLWTDKDSGKEPQRPQEQYPWLYDESDEFTGDRVNDVHLTIAERQAAQEVTT